jgi:hypothetical protein
MAWLSVLMATCRFFLISRADLPARSEMPAGAKVVGGQYVWSANNQNDAVWQCKPLREDGECTQSIVWSRVPAGIDHGQSAVINGVEKPVERQLTGKPPWQLYQRCRTISRRLARWRGTLTSMPLVRWTRAEYICTMQFIKVRRPIRTEPIEDLAL